MQSKSKRKSGQTMVEYIIIVGVIAVVAITVFGIFGDAIRIKVYGATEALSSSKGAEAQSEANKSGADTLKELGER